MSGYVCERKSNHPKLPGHFIVLRAELAGLDVGNECKYAVAHCKGEQMGCFVGMTNLPSARALMYDMAAGGNVADLGQYKE